MLGLERLPRPQAGRPVRRSAPAGRPGPGRRRPPGGVPDGRAAVEPRRQAPHPDPGRAGRPPPAARHHVRLRHPRPGGGHDDGRPDRDHVATVGSSRSGTPREVYETPANLFVAGFIGTPAMNTGLARLGEGHVPGRRQRRSRSATVDATSAASVVVGVRPEHLHLDPAGAAAGDGPPGRVARPRGARPGRTSTGDRGPAPVDRPGRRRRAARPTPGDRGAAVGRHRPRPPLRRRHRGPPDAPAGGAGGRPARHRPRRAHPDGPGAGPARRAGRGPRRRHRQGEGGADRAAPSCSRRSCSSSPSSSTRSSSSCCGASTGTTPRARTSATSAGRSTPTCSAATTSAQGLWHSVQYVLFTVPARPAARHACSPSPPTAGSGASRSSRPSSPRPSPPRPRWRRSSSSC